MVLFPDFVVANGFCADLARLDDMFLLALNDVQQVIGFPRSRVVCFENIVNLGRLLWRFLVQAQFDRRGLRDGRSRKCASGGRWDA